MAEPVVDIVGVVVGIVVDMTEAAVDIVQNLLQLKILQLMIVM